MKQNLLKNNILAILFASGDAYDLAKLSQFLNISKTEIENAIDDINAALESLPITVLKLENAYQITTKPQYGEIIKNALVMKNSAPLSAAAMEVLSIIAYNQPVTRAFVDQIRGVDCSRVVASLMKRDLIEEAGRLKLPGRPIAYKTTRNFLMCFSIESISDLPKIPKEKDGQQILTV